MAERNTATKKEKETTTVVATANNGEKKLEEELLMADKNKTPQRDDGQVRKVVQDEGSKANNGNSDGKKGKDTMVDNTDGLSSKMQDGVDIFSEKYAEDKGFVQGLENLDSIVDLGPGLKGFQGKEVVPGVIGLRGTEAGQPMLGFACGKERARRVTFLKFIALIEHMHDEKTATIVLENPQNDDRYNTARGQMLARVVASHSAIVIYHGVVGRIIAGEDDIVAYNVYYLDKQDLTAFYLAAKAQVSNAHQLDAMIASYEGFKALDIPQVPFDTFSH